MPQEDYLKRQIDQFAKAMAKLLAKLKALKNTETSNIAESTQIVNEVLEKESRLSVEVLLGIPPDHVVTELVQTYNLNEEQLELLADVLLFLSNGHQMEKELLTRTKSILEYIHSSSKTYSMERHFQIEQIKKKINS